MGFLTACCLQWLDHSPIRLAACSDSPSAKSKPSSSQEHLGKLYQSLHAYKRGQGSQISCSLSCLVTHLLLLLTFTNRHPHHRVQQMFAKAICVAVSGISLAFTTVPPSSSGTVSESKDKIKVEGRAVDSNATPYVLTGLALVQTGVCLLLMYLGRPDNVAIQRLRVLESRQVLATLVAVCAMLLRRWTYRTLDRFFTVRPTF